jgi:hypothetical protein
LGVVCWVERRLERWLPASADLMLDIILRVFVHVITHALYNGDKSFYDTADPPIIPTVRPPTFFIFS